MRPTKWIIKFFLLTLSLFSFSIVAIPIGGPAAPSLTGTKYSASIQLDWNSFNSCNSATYEIQESTNASSWSTVYTGAGNSGGDNASFTRSTRKVFGGDNLGGGDGCNVIGGGPLYISLSGRTNEVYYYKIRTCEIGLCGQYGSTLQLGQAGPPPPPPTPSIVIEQLSYHIYQDSSGKLYLVRPPIFVPIAGEIFIPIFLADKGNVIVMTESGGTWTLSEITYEQFLATNAAKKEQAAVRYQNLEGGTDIDLVISLDGQFNNSFVISDINANVHTVTEQDISAEAWRSIAYTAVDNTAGSNTAPSENIDLTASVLKGKAGVSGGQASYQIPIDLPPGRNGIQPRVALSYNSQGGNGTAGVGWSLNAGSAISRCGATYAQDGFTRAVTFNADTDKLCFNGQRLITSGSYGTSGTTYRTEMDSFVKVVQSGGINGTSTSFTVYRPDGSQATYGSNANSRFAPAGLTTSLTWKVTQESWADGYNTIDYEYDTSVAGEHLLSKIYYTGSSGFHGDRIVEFIHEDRNDTRLSYLAGGKTVTERRLKQINTRYGSDIVSKYMVTYKSSNASSRSLIKTVKRCDNAGDCLPVTSFQWSDTTSTIELQPLGTDGTHAYAGIGDIDSVVPHGDRNGDGVRDWAGLYVNAEGEFTASNELDLKPCEPNIYSHRLDCVEGDFNQDGLTDDWENRNSTLYLNITNGSEINTGIQLIAVNKHGLKSSRIVNISDYNGDSWPDLMVFHNYTGSQNSKLKLYLHSKNTQLPYSAAIDVFEYPIFYNQGGSYSLINDIQFVGDMTGDGIPDLIKTVTGSGRRIPYAQPIPKELLTGLGNGYFSASNLNFGINTDPLTPKFTYFIDINSDGLSDWLGWDNRKTLIARLNKGKGVFASEVTLTGDASSIASRFDHISHADGEPDVRLVPKYEAAFKFHDIDNDGTVELLMPGTRIYEGCTLISTAFPAYSQRYRCGEELYGTFFSRRDRSSIQSINSAIADQSVYQFDALSFSTQADGSVSVTKKSTNLYGHAYQSIIIDAFGNGLPTLAFNHKSQAGTRFNGSAAGTPFSGFESSYGVYINRNYGSGSGQTNSDYNSIDYLQSVTDGIGNQSSWRYRPLSTGEESADNCGLVNGERKCKMYLTDHEYVGDGYIHFGSSMYVVQSFEQSNGIGGTNETEYGYKGAMYNLEGRGFTGFREIIEKDVSRNRVTTNVFKQKFPEVSLLESQTVKVNGTTVSTTAKTWAENPKHNINGVFHNINTSTKTDSYGLNGSSERRSSVKSLVGPCLDIANCVGDATYTDQYGHALKHTKIVTDYIDGDANSYQTVVDTVFTPDTSNWFLGKFGSKTSTTSVRERSWSNDPIKGNLSSQSQTLTVNAWHPLHHKPTQATYTASGSNCDRVETTTLNDYGLPTQVSVTGDSSSCASLTSRATSFTYTKNGSSQADDGYLPYQITNAKGHISKTEYDMGLGVPLKVTAPNSIITQTQYDAIGRPVQMSQTGSPTRYLRYLLASSGSHAPTHAKLMTRTTSAGMPSQETYLDSLGRNLRSATQAFDGSNYQYLDKKYDSLGHLTHESLPYYDGNTPEYTIFSGFDGFDRPTSRSLPNGESGGLISTYDYTGLKTDISVEGRTMSRTYGMQGLLYETVDAAGGSNRFAYDGAGRPLVIQDANNSKIKASYNGFGHKTEVDDPNQGITTFGYSSLGELDTQTDENGVIQTFALDTLGRITSKTITGSNANGTASYTWDTLKKGMLSSESENGISRSYTYTSKLQLATSSVKVASSHGGDNVTRTVKHQYDGFYGRPKALTYPNNLTLEYRYNDTGYLNQTRNAASGYIYRTVTDMDAAGHLTGSQMANALLTQSSNYNSEGTMASTQVTSSLGLLHNHYYDQYDSFMNLTAERNAVSGLEKSYAYDDLNRLEQYSFSNSGFAIYDNPIKFAATVDYGYDAVGNLLKKSDYSINSNNAYEYGGSCGGPNRVCAITKELNHQRVTFNYDSRGNLLVGDDLTMTYNALDKPLTIIGRGPGNNTNTAFVYGSDNMRALQTRTVSGTTTKTHYVDKLFETDNDGSWRAYIADIAVLSYTPQKSHQLLYTLRDRLGSATTMVDHLGNEISRRYFDPFGRTATASVSGSFGDLLDTNRNRRGFTDHEHLNEQKLIHMNGRVYDYNMGRFMSVDPLIQSPTSTQSINPYSYIMNNPLAGTDPTGYKSEVEEVVTGSRIKRKMSVSGNSITSSSSNVTFSGNVTTSTNGASQSQQPQKADVQVDKIGGPGENKQQGSGDSGTNQSESYGNSMLYDASANGGEFDDLPGKFNTGKNTLDKEKLIIGGIEVAAGGTGIVTTVIAAGACIVLEPCGALAISAIVAGATVSVITTNDGLNKIRSAQDGVDRPNTIPAIGNMVAGSEGEKTGAIIDKALSVFGGTKSLATVAKGIEKNTPEILESIDAAKTVYSEVFKEN